MFPRRPLVSLCAALALLAPAARAALTPGAPDEPFTLTFRVAEPRIMNGELQTEIIAKRFELDPALVERSREIGRLSSKLTPQLEDIFARLEAREPKNAWFSREDGRWVARQQSGWVVDRDGTRRMLWEAIRSGRSQSPVRVSTVEPERSVPGLARAGILHHFGGGQSSYAGSPDFREHNVLTGARKLSGLYVMPGAEFDFNAEVGEISEEAGWVAGYVIAGNTLELEPGGGLCQVSTTLFRAAFESGLPITERHQHSYHVHYYDPPGYEATVYAPYKNLKFRNDTGVPLLIQAAWDREQQTLRFDFFGPRNEREVHVADPVVTDRRAPGAPTFVAREGVPLREERRIDGPEEGMTAVIERRVTYPDGTVRTDEVRSEYVPWGGVYAVNPDDPRLP